MKIGLVSDTHGDRAVLQKVINRAGPVALWLHAGDYARDADYLQELTGMPVYAVGGNCDPRDAAPPDRFLNFGAYHIMLTHGHRYHVKHGLRDLISWGRQYEVNTVVFGHTHKALICREGDILLVNPGSPAFPRGAGAASFGILELSPAGIQPSIIAL